MDSTKAQQILEASKISMGKLFSVLPLIFV